MQQTNLILDYLGLFGLDKSIVIFMVHLHLLICGFRAYIDSTRQYLPIKRLRINTSDGYATETEQFKAYYFTLSSFLIQSFTNLFYLGNSIGG